MKSRVNKDTNTYCWLWSANCYESIEQERKEWIKKQIKEKYKSKKHNKRKKIVKG